MENTSLGDLYGNYGLTTLTDSLYLLPSASSGPFNVPHRHSLVCILPYASINIISSLCVSFLVSCMSKPMVGSRVLRRTCGVGKLVVESLDGQQQHKLSPPQVVLLGRLSRLSSFFFRLSSCFSTKPHLIREGLHSFTVIRPFIDH